MLSSYIIWMFLGMIVVVVARAWINSETVNIALSFKDFSNTYFRLGVSFTREVYLDKQVDMFSVCMFFVNLDIELIQPLSERDQELVDIIKKHIDDNGNNNATAESDDSSVQP